MIGGNRIFAFRDLGDRSYNQIECISVGSCNEVIGAYDGLESLTDDLEGVVTCFIAISIINGFEAVKIHLDEEELVIRASLLSCQFFCQSALERTFIWKARLCVSFKLCCDPEIMFL